MYTLTVVKLAARHLVRNDERKRGEKQNMALQNPHELSKLKVISFYSRHVAGKLKNTAKMQFLFISLRFFFFFIHFWLADTGAVKVKFGRCVKHNHNYAAVTTGPTTPVHHLSTYLYSEAIITSHAINVFPLQRQFHSLPTLRTRYDSDFTHSAISL